MVILSAFFKLYDSTSTIRPTALYSSAVASTLLLHAIKNILENPDDVEILNKKSIFLYLRELTGLNTKQIATSLKKYREKYRYFKKDWEES